MANRFSDIAKQMGAKMNDEVETENGQAIAGNELSVKNNRVVKESAAKEIKKEPKKETGRTPPEKKEIPAMRKTTAIPLVLDLAIKEVKERRNIAGKIQKTKKITEDDVIVEALELYFGKAENKSCLEAATEKLKYFE
jgi:hypothetical protein